MSLKSFGISYRPLLVPHNFVPKTEHVSTPTMLRNILYPWKNPNFKVSLIETFRGSVRKIGADPIVAYSPTWVQWDKNPDVLRKFNWSNFAIDLPAEYTDGFWAKSILPTDRISNPTAQHKLKKPSKLHQLQIKHLKNRKIFNPSGEIPLCCPPGACELNSKRQEMSALW